MPIGFSFLEDDGDDHCEPKTKVKKKAKMSKALVRGKIPAHSKRPVDGKTRVENGGTKSTSVSASPAVQAISMPEAVQAATQRIQIVANDAMLKGNGYRSEIVPDDSV